MISLSVNDLGGRADLLRPRIMKHLGVRFLHVPSPQHFHFSLPCSSPLQSFLSPNETILLANLGIQFADFPLKRFPVRPYSSKIDHLMRITVRNSRKVRGGSPKRTPHTQSTGFSRNTRTSGMHQPNWRRTNPAFLHLQPSRDAHLFLDTTSFHSASARGGAPQKRGSPFSPSFSPPFTRTDISCPDPSCLLLLLSSSSPIPTLSANGTES